MSKLTHLDSAGNAHMVDVSEKDVTSRSATAKAVVEMQPETLRLVLEGKAKKGDVIATARIVLPKAKIRLSAGRDRLTREAQALCLFAGANSIFYGDKLLTATNPGVNDDRALLEALGLEAQAPYADQPEPALA